MEPHHRKSLRAPGTGRLLIAGFGALLLLMGALTSVSFSQMKAHQAHLDQLVSGHMAKVALSLQMRTAARERTLILLRLLYIQDPFVRDQEWMRFNNYAASFVEAREAILAMPVSHVEKALLEQQAELSRIAVPIQHRIVELIEDGDMVEAGRLLNAEAIPAQARVIAMVDRFDTFQRESAEQAQQQAARQLAQLRTLVVTLGSGAVALGVLIAITVIRTVGQRGQRDAYLATHDPLTGLPNRALLMDRLQRAIQLCERNRTRLGLLFIDVDRFKEVNDSYGHATGDQALQLVRDRIQSQLRKSDTLARLSGDEFVVLLEELRDAAAAQQTAERVVAAFDEPSCLGEQTIRLSVSVGIALYPEHGSNHDELLSHGDTAMYRSKSQGRHRWTLYDSSLPT